VLRSKLPDGRECDSDRSDGEALWGRSLRVPSARFWEILMRVKVRISWRKEPHNTQLLCARKSLDEEDAMN